MFKVICSTILIILLSFDMQVFAGPIYDKIQKGIEENLEVFRKYKLIYNERELTDRAKHTIVDGVTLEQFVLDRMALYQDVDSTFTSTYSQRHNRAKVYFEQIKAKEIACRNIVEMYSPYGVYHDPSDYLVVAGWYIHTFGRYNKEYDCRHSSLEGLQNHVYWINESDKAYRDMISTPETPNNNAINAYVNEQVAQFVADVEPYKKAYIAAQEQIRAEKSKEIEKQIAMIEPKLEKIICEKVIGTQDIANIKLLTKKIRCKKFKQCRLVAAHDDGENVWLGCNCGHGMEFHKFVFKKGVDYSKEQALLHGQ